MSRKVSAKRYSEIRKIIQSWPELERESIARDLVREMPPGKLDDLADDMKRRAYYSEIRSMAEDYVKRVRAGEFTDRETLIEDIQGTIDGHHDVIYTACAQDVVRYSDNSGAWEDLGSDGIVENGAINWTRMAYCAMERDLFEQLSANGVDVNADPPTIGEE